MVRKDVPKGVRRGVRRGACRGVRRDVEQYYILYIISFIEYGHEANPSILGLQIAFLAARKDYYYYRARQEL